MVRAAPAPFPERGFLLGRLSNAGLTVPRPAPPARGRRPKPFTVPVIQIATDDHFRFIVSPPYYGNFLLKESAGRRSLIVQRGENRSVEPSSRLVVIDP